MSKKYSQRQSQDYSNFNSDVETQEPQEKFSRMGRKRSSFLQTFAETFNSYSHARRIGMVGRIGSKRKFSTSLQSIRYYKQRITVYKFLHGLSGVYSGVYHMALSILILISIVLTVLSTVNGLKSDVLNEVLYGFDVVVLVVFIIEYSLRFWASECVSKYRKFKGKVRFIFSPFRVLDMIVIITSLMIVGFSIKYDHFIVPQLQWIRFFQTFKMIRLEHRFRPWRVMASVIWSQREHLYITTYISVLSLVLMSFLIYFIERDVNPGFNNLGESLWWAVITLCTIGYGDVAPVTTAGKILAALFSIIGVSLFALPAGILGTGLALKVEEQQRVRQIGRRKVPAVKLIQCRWRYHKFKKNPYKCLVWTVGESCHQSGQVIRRQLKDSEINCIKFILKTKYFLSRRHFQQTIKPYDFKDVLEQYSAGHMEMLARIKYINHKINGLETTVWSGLKGQQESKSHINYRLTKLEDCMTQTNSKLDLILTTQNQNRVLFESILMIFETTYDKKLNNN